MVGGLVSGGSVGRGVWVGTGVSEGTSVGGRGVRVSVAARVGTRVAVRTAVTTGRRGTHSNRPVRMRLDDRQLALRSRATVVPVSRAI